MTPDPRRSTRRRLALATLLLVAVTACGGGTSRASTPYLPPATTAGDDGWQIYVDAPTVDRAAARGLDPAPATPEAAVVKFLASRARGDDAWAQAMVAAPSGRAERALAEWEEWRLESFQLRARKQRDADHAYVRVHFQITVDGHSDGGEDEFELVRETGGWRVASPPA